MIELAAKLLAAYLLGGLMGGDLLRVIFGGADLRTTGSGNVGATNALRSRGAPFALGVLAIDIGKGIVAALLIPALHWPLTSSALPAAQLGFACGFAAALGHCFPVFRRFRGGKGVATATGIFGALLPAALPWLVGAFALVVMLTGQVALASITGALIAVLYVGCFGSGLDSAAGVFALGMALLIVVKHRSNIAKLFAGEERGFEKARVLGRALERLGERLGVRWRGR